LILPFFKKKKKNIAGKIIKKVEEKNSIIQKNYYDSRLEKAREEENCGMEREGQ
jgi:hypothetical protein